MVEGPLIYIPGRDLLVAITTNPDLQGDGVEVPDGEIAHLDDDHGNENGTGIEIEGEIVKGTGIEIGIEIRTGTEKRREGEGVTERLKKEAIGFQGQRRRL